MSREQANYLFAGRDLDDVLRSTERGIPERINQVGKDQFMASSDEQLVEHFVAELSVGPLTLYEDRAEMDQVEARVDVSGDWNRVWSDDRSGPRYIPGTRVIVTIPFTGDAELWKLKPNPYRMSFPLGEVRSPRGNQPGCVVFTIEKPHDAGQEQFKQVLDEFLQDTRHHIEAQRNQVETFNAKLPQLVRSAVTARRERLKRHEGLSQMLNIPLKQREGVPSIEPIRLKEKIVKPLPTPPKSGWQPEPGIDEKNYENVLKIIRHQGRTFETTPATYNVHDEEELRDMVVANLNIYLEGEVGGETFRKSGKTDICVKEGDRAAFVAECAMWRGEKHLLRKADQLLGYLTWRDCKAALIMFNKEVTGFAELLNKVPEALARHRFLVKDLGQQGEGEWRYVFRSAEDEGRRITVHVFLFDLFVK